MKKYLSTTAVLASIAMIAPAVAQVSPDASPAGTGAAVSSPAPVDATVSSISSSLSSSVISVPDEEVNRLELRNRSRAAEINRFGVPSSPAADTTADDTIDDSVTTDTTVDEDTMMFDDVASPSATGVAGDEDTTPGLPNTGGGALSGTDLS